MAHQHKVRINAEFVRTFCLKTNARLYSHGGKPASRARGMSIYNQFMEQMRQFSNNSHRSHAISGAKAVDFWSKIYYNEGVYLMARAVCNFSGSCFVLSLRESLRED